MSDQAPPPKDKHLALLEEIRKIRESKTVAFKRPAKMLRTEIVGLDGKPQEFRLRYYQVQGAYHLLKLKRMILGDGTGLGKTVQIIAFLCYLWESDPESKAIVVAPKSALRQWKSELARFATGVKVFVVSGGPAERKAVYDEFLAHPMTEEKAVLVLNY